MVGHNIEISSVNISEHLGKVAASPVLPLITPLNCYRQQLCMMYKQTRICTLWTVNDVTGKEKKLLCGAFHLKRPLRSCKLKFEGSFLLREAVETPQGLSRGSFLVTSLRVHGVCSAYYSRFFILTLDIRWISCKS